MPRLTVSPSIDEAAPRKIYRIEWRARRGQGTVYYYRPSRVSAEVFAAALREDGYLHITIKEEPTSA
jgi:hypothetical protein